MLVPLLKIYSHYNIRIQTRFKQPSSLYLLGTAMRISVEEQKRMFEHHLQIQQKQREAKLEVKRLEELEKKNPQEHMLHIQKLFRTHSELVEAETKKYKDKECSFEDLMSVYEQAKEYYVNVSYALKTYDRQYYKQSLDKMYNTIIDLKKKHEPRKKFKFSRRDGDFGVKATDSVEVSKIGSDYSANVPGLSQKNGETIVVKEGWTSVGSYKVVECEGCTIDISEKTEILFLKKLKNCTVRAALTKSTVFVDQCDDCTLQINCHQLRIHNSYRTTFKIFVTSKAIIEDCNQVTFTPYTFQYEGRQADEQEFERAGKQNLWREIQDFNWLKQNQKSPHYELVE